MRVEIKIEKNEQVVKGMSFDEMKAQEGVYKPLDDSCRLLVLKTGCETTVLYVSGTCIEPAEECWHTNRFVKVDESITFTINKSEKHCC